MGSAEVALVVRCPLCQLSVVVAELARDRYLAGRLGHQERGFGGGLQPEAVPIGTYSSRGRGTRAGRTAIPSTPSPLCTNSISSPLALRKKYDIGSETDRGREHEVVVADQRHARVDGVTALRITAGEPVPVLDRIVGQKPDQRTIPWLHVERRGRRPQMVRQRIDALETLWSRSALPRTDRRQDCGTGCGVCRAAGPLERTMPLLRSRLRWPLRDYRVWPVPVRSRRTAP